MNEATTNALPGLQLASKRGRWVLAATVLGSTIVFLEATVINVALPTLGRELNSGITGLQWMVNGYMLTLAALILLGGSLGDHYGRRRVFVIGTIWFTLASLACAFATSAEWLIAARVLQGVGGALLTPGSLALIEASFRPEDRGRAIGLWSGMAGVSTAVGPALGGYLIDAVSWRAIFYINVPVGIAVVWIALKYVPDSRSSSAGQRLDSLGAALATIGLAAATWALIESPNFGAHPTAIATAAALGALSLLAFIQRERTAENPMLPLGVFRSRNFSGANLVTFVVYGALGGMMFTFITFLQVALGYSPLQAGAATIPITVLMLLLSARAGALAHSIGPKIMLTAGPLVMAVAMLMMTRVAPGDSYWPDVFVPLVVFGLGLATTVAPVTTTALATAPTDHAGMASAVNNAVSRTGQLIVVAVLPAVVGLSGAQYRQSAAVTSAMHGAMLFTAGLATAGAAIAWLMISQDALDSDLG
ncbi:MAG: MFS transporter [Thermoleophilaceae bacterium]|nr:MFS transporter [Thermoleophilaceae bacterium]